MAKENVCSVEKENRLGFYRLHTIFNDDFLKINVASKDGAWTGQVSKRKLVEMSQDLQRPLDVYVRETLEALTTQGGQSGIAYSVEDNNFVWKAVDNDVGMKIKLGGIPLEPANFVDTIQTMMQVSLDRNIALQETISRLEHDKTSSQQNVNAAMQKLVECQKSKKLMEDDLYTTFISVLNAKKRKIKDLEVQLIDERSRAPQKKTRGKKNGKRVAQDPYDEDTDEADEDPGPSTSKSPRRTSNSKKKLQPKSKPMSTREATRRTIVEATMLTSSSDESTRDPSVLDELSNAETTASMASKITPVNSPAKDNDLPSIDKNIEEPPLNSTGQSSTLINPDVGESSAQNCIRSSAITARSEAFLDDLLGVSLKDKDISKTEEVRGRDGLIHCNKSSSIENLNPLVSSKARDIIEEFF